MSSKFNGARGNPWSLGMAIAIHDKTVFKLRRDPGVMVSADEALYGREHDDIIKRKHFPR